MNMAGSASPGPYLSFVDILTTRWTTPRHIALTGEMIKAAAEMDEFLATIKGKAPENEWVEFANRFEACELIYKVAWAKFKASPIEWPFRAHAIEELEDAFRAAVDSMRVVVDDAHRYEERHGGRGWIGRSRSP